MTDQHSRQARIDALKQDIAHLQAEHITDEQLARMTEIINEASVQNHQHASGLGLAEKFFQTENLVKKLQNHIVNLQESDLLINNEIRLVNLQKQLKAAHEKLQELADLIAANQQELEHFKHMDANNHLDLTRHLHEIAQNV